MKGTYRIIDRRRRHGLIRLYLAERPDPGYTGDDWDDSPYERNAGPVCQDFVDATPTLAVPWGLAAVEPAGDRASALLDIPGMRMTGRHPCPPARSGTPGDRQTVRVDPVFGAQAAFHATPPVGGHDLVEVAGDDDPAPHRLPFAVQGAPFQEERPYGAAGGVRRPAPVGLVFGEPVQPAQPIVVHHTGAYASPAGDAYADTDKTPVPDGGGKEEP